MARKKKTDEVFDSEAVETETTETETTETEAVETETTETEAVETETEAPKTKREIILDTIEAGGATMESLTEAAECKYASVMSIFSMLRLMGKCPVKDVPAIIISVDEDGNDVETEIMTYRVVSLEEWEELKTERASKSKVVRQPKKSPEEQLTAIGTRIDRLTKAAAAAQDRFDKHPESEILDLRSQKAAIELQIANLEYTELNAQINA